MFLRRTVERMLRPDVLFTLATLQALSPYLFWQLGVGRAMPSSELAYTPVLVWAVGWASFLLGAFLVRRRLQPVPGFTIIPSSRRVYRLTWAAIALSIAQLILLVQVYGTLPILSYVLSDGKIDVISANSMQEQSGVGQIALLNLTTYILTGLLCQVAIIAIERGRKVHLVFYCGLAMALFNGLINGKRNGMFRLVVFLLVALLLYSRSAARNLTALLPFIRRPATAVLLTAGFIALGLAAFGPIAAMRNQGKIEVDSGSEAVNYQEGPLLNLEAQTKQAGLGPWQVDLLFPLQQMIPLKWSATSELFSMKPPPRIDQSAPAGFYELIQWAWGLPGIVLFSVAIGSLSMWIYTTSRTRLPALLCYGQIAYSLLMAHSFNEFLIAPYVLAPCVLHWALGSFTGRPAARAAGKPFPVTTTLELAA